MAKKHGPSIKDDERYAAIREERAGKEKATRIANTPPDEMGPRGGSGAYEDWTKKELYEKAKDVDIGGRSTMTKDELIDALRLDPNAPLDAMIERTTFDRSRPIEEWTNEELIDQFRYVKAELADEDPEYRNSEDAPADVIEKEIKRRGLTPDREDVIPDASSPGRENDETLPRVRG